MTRCAALGCTNNDDNGGVFFTVPSESRVKLLWERNLGRHDLGATAVICEDHFSPQDFLDEPPGKKKTLKPDAIPSMFGAAKDIAAKDSPVRRTNRQRLPKKLGYGDEFAHKRKPHTPTTPKVNKLRNKGKALSNGENPEATASRKSKKIHSESLKDKQRTSTKRESALNENDERGEAIAEWYLTDIFEATKFITNVLQKGAFVTDELISNMEETIIDITSKLLQRISSIIITTLEDEFGKRSKIINTLKQEFVNTNTIVKTLIKDDTEFSKTKDQEVCLDTAVEDILEGLDPQIDRKNNWVTEEVISTPLDRSLMILDHPYSLNTTLQDERLLLKKSEKKGQPQLQCAFCNYKTRLKSRLSVHVQRHLKRYDCSLCDYTVKSFESFQKHYRVHTGEKPFVCKICGFRTANPSNLKRHKIKHDGNKPFQCYHCNFSAAQKYALVKHIHRHIKKTQIKASKSVYVCEECNFVTISLTEFRTHNKETHTSFICGHCDFVADTVAAIREHELSHKGEEHICSICQYKCLSAATLRLHKMTHSSSEQFACNLCGYRTHLKTYLNRHVTVHSGDKPYECSYCLKKFRLQSQLKLHVRKHEVGPFCKKYQY